MEQRAERHPTGRPKRGLASTEALRAQGTPDELAELVRKAAREGAPWAIQMIFNRLEPQSSQINLTQENPNANPTDYSRLTTDAIQQLECLLERARDRATKIEDGESTTLPA